MKKTMITMPETMAEAVKQHVADRFYGSVSEYVRDLIRADLQGTRSQNVVSPAATHPSPSSIENASDEVDLSGVYEVWDHSGGHDDDDEDEEYDEYPSDIR